MYSYCSHHPATMKTCVSLIVCRLAKVAYHIDKCPVPTILHLANWGLQKNTLAIFIPFINFGFESQGRSAKGQKDKGGS